MQLSTKFKTGVMLIALSLAGALVGGCAKQADDSSATGSAATPNNSVASGEVQTPASPQDDRAGKTVEDSTAKFSKFRVGENNVKALYVSGKVVWVGTSNGVIRYNTETDDFRLFDNRDGLLSKGIFHVGAIDGKIVVGTYGGGMSIYDETSDKWENYNIPNGLADAFVYKVIKASNGDVWIATWSGANRIRGGDLKDRSKWDVYTVENTQGGLPNDWVYSLEEGKDGVIWFATEGGLARFKDDKWQNWNHDKGLGVDFEKIKNDPQFGTDPSKFSEHHAKQAKEMGLEGVSGGGAYNPNYVVSLLVDKNGIVWSGTWGGGLSRFDGSKLQNYSMADGLPGNHVFMLHQDPAGKMWVGTNNGLASFDGKNFKTEVTTENGLHSNSVFAMATGVDTSQWVGTYGAVTHINAVKK
ncbi:MAG: two-component regulator propeller domain-containing protein [Gallionella sp.]